MRTYDEIIARIEERKGGDIFFTEVTGLLCRLPFEKAKPYLRKGCTKDSWEPHKSSERASILQEMKAYMSPAWYKANKYHKWGTSRAMHQYMVWVWLMGDDLGELTEYEYDCKDNLVKICEYYGFEYKHLDDGIRVSK